jgi:mannose-6-phosphate isomerase-like protein (cupin superfamily)|tara:strand:+ start:386 stop:904 length:519 start_codon:yes stop_codon:yes gene_type:complete
MNFIDTESLKINNLNEVKVFKNIIKFDNEFNFNDILDLISFSYFKNTVKFADHVGINMHDIFSHTFQIFDVSQYEKLKDLHKQLCVFFGKNIEDSNFKPHIFFSFRSATGPLHSDNENVFIVGLEGKTYYDFPSLKRIYEIEKTDAIYIPAKLMHAASSIQKRIICSWGIYK